MKDKLFIIDAHEDVALNALYDTSKDIGKRHKVNEGFNPYGFPIFNNVDIPRLKAGKVKFVFATIFSLPRRTVLSLVKKKNAGYNFKKLLNLKTDLLGALEQLSFYYQNLRKYKNEIGLVTSKKDYLEIRNSSKIGLILHSEGISYFEDENYLDIFYQFGLRSVALTWREKNKFGGGNNAKGGLTPLGKRLIKKCQELGMIIDLAHANQKTFYDVIRIVNQPIIVSHSNVYSLCSHKRNLTDDQIKEIAKLGGVICLSVIYDQIGGVTIKDYIKHFLYIIDLVGIDYVGFGTDFDGLMDPDIVLIKEFEDVSKFGNVVKEFKKAGLNEEAIKKICYKNLERVLLESLK